MTDVLPPRGVQGCVFDAYGTLFEFAAAARKCRDVLGDDIDRLTTLWRDKQLQYTWLRAAQGRHADFWQVTGDALDFALETLGLTKFDLRDRLMSLYLTLDPFSGSFGRPRSVEGRRDANSDPFKWLARHARCRRQGSKVRNVAGCGAFG